MKILDILKNLPALTNLLTKWLDLQIHKIPMKIKKHEERTEVREMDAKYDALRREDKGRKRNEKRDKRSTRRTKKSE